jgi:hypothetical protein
MSGKQNKCPHPTCDKMKPLDMYACRKHWASLPRDIQQKIYAGFYKMKKGDGTDWQAADKVALEYWGKKLKPTAPVQGSLL